MAVWAGMRPKSLASTSSVSRTSPTSSVRVDTPAPSLEGHLDELVLDLDDHAAGAEDAEDAERLGIDPDVDVLVPVLKRR